MTRRLFPWALVVLIGSLPAPGAAADDGFVPMFNGKDLSGWVNANCAPGTFYVKDGEIITTGKPTGFLRTARQYENFVADFEWMHVNTKEVGNSGFFVWADPLPAVGTPYTRGIEVQVLVNLEKPGFYTSQGDLFSIHGATCKPDRPHPNGWARCLPSENRCKGGGEWNHYIVTANNGVITLSVNGKVVSGVSNCDPRKGYLALESEGAECHFRNLKIKELPSTNPDDDEVAAVAPGFRQLYSGLDLSGWAGGDAVRARWQPRDWVLHAAPGAAPLATAANFGEAFFIADFRFLPVATPTPPSAGFAFLAGTKDPIEVTIDHTGKVRVRQGETVVTGGAKKFRPVGQWNRLGINITDGSLRVSTAGELLAEMAVKTGDRGHFELRPGQEMEFGNLFVRTPER